MSKYQYRLKVNGATGPVLDTYPGEQWSKVAEVIDARGGTAAFERRLVTDHDILPLLTDPTGYLDLSEDIIVCPWEIIAGMEV